MQTTYTVIAERRGFEEKEKAEQDAISEKKKELERIEQERLQKEVCHLTLFPLSLSLSLSSAINILVRLHLLRKANKRRKRH